ncbi:uncharacterized protein NEPG_01030 [Nematocida parisii ERTm1]|uniref:Uncharacterized protein n=1 Tax=Nematocida parisii (strain ERTm3) TaxID=935791 RepID=I3EJP7_NEMP3|nr:uncharacterized protein NEPG_01030 [Nematocida parisii ERTm1]EIJ89444.1 hypothetical protein NEQG_00214 [Nematocida parisii ERTm3]EIJ94362.1 hypothetical protein NEPG_01030 [Nematocida parisii ERTm1]KAI5145220.1 hypothetical protein NEPAR07_1546 [Nematocida parisii]|eukprot:XP_013058858.1 hypothetical protein NEPG_01030 [Nematocida parisii ERTm1]
MEDKIRIISTKRSLIDEIMPGDSYENASKIKKVSGVYREFKTSDVENSPTTPCLSIMRGLAFEEIRRSWEFADFFPTKTTVSMNNMHGITNKSRPRSTITMNRALDKGAPYLMYSVDGHKYYIRKERTTDNEDTVGFIYKEDSPIKISLYRNTAEFLTGEYLDIVECTELTQHRILLPNSLDMAVPEKGGSFIPVLREMESTKAINNKKMYLDKIDMCTGKIDNYILQCKDSTRKYKRISNTWHPQQYIAMNIDTVGIIDLREKTSNTFWQCRSIARHYTTDELSPNYTVEKGAESKIYVNNGKALGSFDMRNLTTLYGIKDTGVHKGILSVGKHPAVYNHRGHFYFQSYYDSDNQMVKLYNFNTNYSFIGFDWIGKSANLPFTMAAFLFENKIHIYTGDGQVNELPIVCKKRPCGRQAMSHELLRLLKKGKVYSSKLLKKSSLPRINNSDNDPYTFLERSLLDGFRDPLDKSEDTGISTQPNDSVKKTIPYTKMIEYLSTSDMTALAKEKSNEFPSK